MPYIWVAIVVLALSDTRWALAPAGAESRADTHPGSAVGRSHDVRSNETVASDHPVAPGLFTEMVKRTIQKYLEGEWGSRVKTVQVAVLEPSEAIKIPPGVVELQVNPAPSEEGLGRRMFHVVATTNGKPWKTIEVLTDVAAMVDVVVPNRFLKSEELIDAEDLTLARIRIHAVPHPFITDLEEVIGKSAARPLQADTPLRLSFLKKPLMIKKGDRVMIEAKRGGLSIQTSGVTKASGQIGQTIMVANLDSGRELRAKIVAPGLVRVEF